MITSIDHIVMTAADPDATIAFYCDLLGMELQPSSRPTATRHGGRFVSAGRRSTFTMPRRPMCRMPAGRLPARSICVSSATCRSPSGSALRERCPAGARAGPEDGRDGPFWSVYVRDPDGNLIEISSQMQPD